MGKDMCEYISKLDFLNWTNIIDNKYDEYKEQSTR